MLSVLYVYNFSKFVYHINPNNVRSRFYTLNMKRLLKIDEKLMELLAHGLIYWR